jgi:ketosteroid isomerase-like protein
MTTATDTDREKLLELHRSWNAVNDTGDLDWLREHIAPDSDDENDFVMYNTVGSNFYGQRGIVDLWTRLGEAAAASDSSWSRSETAEPHLVVSGDLAVITYLGRHAGDLGEGTGGAFDDPLRHTEVWRRLDGEWKMIHYHGSPRQPGELGGE